MICAPVVVVKNIKNALIIDIGVNNMDKSNISLDVQLANILFRLTVIEHLLLQKGLISPQELEEASQTLLDKVSKVILQKLDATQSLDELIASLSKDSKN